MKIRNAIPPLALSALLITNVFAQNVESQTKVAKKNSSAKSEATISGKVNQPTPLKTGTSGWACTEGAHC